MKRSIACTCLLVLAVTSIKLIAQNNADVAGGSESEGKSDFDSSAYYTRVKTYVNPVLGGDHPDPTLLKVGNDFYMCGSSFHFNPYLPILHSTDLVHWEEISRAVPSDWQELKSGRSGAGIWQGAITFCYNTYWIYFSNGSGSGQYFCKATSPKGPWSLPIKVKTNATTGNIGYDNSVFVDDDGTPYMLTKAGKPINRIQKIGLDGHLTGEAIDIDWINANGRYSWAEGPVMFKRNGQYFYTFARDVGGGQFLYRTNQLSSDSSKWEALGNFFSPIHDPSTGFRVSNHMSAPVQLNDGTWWAIAQSYEKVNGEDWSGQGRQSLLHKIEWDSNGRPWGNPASTAPIDMPALAKSNLPWLLPRSDYFDSRELKLSWHFLNPAVAKKYALSRKGWLSITPDSTGGHLLQKEGGHYYSMVTKVDIDANSKAAQAGIYLTNGDETVTVKLYSGFSDGKKIVFTSGNTTYQIENTTAKITWLKLERKEHDLYGYYSADGLNWKPVGEVISAIKLDKAQPDFNHWVGTSIGLFAEGKRADFDLFLYKDGSSDLPLAGYNNFFGIQTLATEAGKVVTNTSAMGGWLMLGGIDFTTVKNSGIVVVTAAAINGENLEIWMDDVEGNGKLLAKLPITKTGGLHKYQTFSATIPPVSGQHDIYLRFPKIKNAFLLKTLRFSTKDK